MLWSGDRPNRVLSRSLTGMGDTPKPAPEATDVDARPERSIAPLPAGGTAI